MKALCYVDKQLQFVEVEEPYVNASDDVKIKVKYNTIGPEDMGMFTETDFYSRKGIVGYEMSGVVVDVGRQAQKKGVEIGDTVTCLPLEFCGKCHFCLSGQFNYCVDVSAVQGFMCEFVLKKSSHLTKINTSLKLGSLIASTAEGLEIMERSQVNMGSSVLIWGGNYKSIILMKLAKLRGAREITVVTSSHYLGEFAKSQGADHVLSYDQPDFQSKVLEITDFYGYNFVFDTTGDNANILHAMSVLANGGSLGLTMQCNLGDTIKLSTSSIFYKNINIIGVSLSSNKFDYAMQMLPMLHLESLITREFSFAEAIEAYHYFDSNKCHKIAIRFDE